MRTVPFAHTSRPTPARLVRVRSAGRIVRGSSLASELARDRRAVEG